MAVSVRKLVQRGRVGDAVRDRIALEDALSTALPDDSRLVLVRRMQVHGQVADPASRQEAVRRGWVEAVSGAVHATQAGASRANCVWFASRLEAEALLLRKLLAGEVINGWFWKLAVPGWDGVSSTEWLPRALAECLTRNDSDRLVRLAETCVEAGFAQRLVEAIERSFCASGNHPGEAGQAIVDVRSAGTFRSKHAADETIEAGRIAVNLVPLVLPVRWSEVLDRIERSVVSPEVKARIVEAVLQERIRRTSPALSLRPQLLRLVAKLVAEKRDGCRITAPERADPSPARVGGAGSHATKAHAEPIPARSARPVVRQSRAREVHAPLLLDEPADVPPHRPDNQPEGAGSARLHASLHAGLWLVVPPLIRLGLREWLAERIELLGQHPGRSLILAIALHHCIASDDPALSMLAPIDDDCPVPGWTDAWRIGLDRWLRRTARRRTHDLVRRPGCIRVAEERVDIHFPLEAADLRLRRPALDLDPGWTDWLGLSLYYHFGAGEAP